jgi:small subunit ribosomal protein S8
MSQDIVSDTLNKIMNAKKANKSYIVATRFSKLLLKVLDMMKQYGYIDYTLNEGILRIEMKELSICSSIKPRYTVNKENLDKYVRRFLPARDYGYVIISTSKGLMTNAEAKENNLGGSLIAYFY